MLNYIKSEFYRITHSAAVYVTALAFAALPLLLNVILHILNLYIPGYQYATTSFSFSNAVAMPMLLCYGALIVVLNLYEGNRRNGNLKNAVASGISKEKIFIGQLVVSFVSCAVILAAAEAVYISSALLLLRNEGPVVVADMGNEIAAVLPIALAALVLGVAVTQIFDKISTGLILWLSIMCFVPKALFLLGLEFQTVRGLAMWMPENFFSVMQINMSVCEPIWDTPEGLAKCLISGFAGILLFGTMGVWGIRKKEL